MAAVAVWTERVIRPHWAVIVHNNRTEPWNKLNETAVRLGASLKLLADAERPPSRAKLLFQLRFTPLLDDEDYIWLLDGDIDLTRFRLDDFLTRWQCSFPSGPPIIAQPVALHSTQYFWHLNWDTWATWQPLPWGTPVPLVEMQMPLMHGSFFKHLASGVGRHISARALQHEDGATR
eukprot:scaffold264898_cov28-Tisochrysis_lutea.AAC.1